MNYLNQVRHFYVAKAIKNHETSDDVFNAKAYYDATEYSSIAKAVNAGKSVTVGDIRVGKTVDGKEIYFESVGANGLITRSDAIPLDNILYANAKKATELSETLKQVDVVLRDDPVANQDYILNIEINNYVTPSERSTLLKWGAVHATSGMTKSNFYIALAKSLANNFKRDIEKMLKIYLTTTSLSSGTDKFDKPANLTEVTGSDAQTLAGTYTGIIIRAAEQDWKLGLFEQTNVYFTVNGASIVNAGVEVNPWKYITNDDYTTGITEITDNPGVPFDASTKLYMTNYNAKKTADLEWFAMKARADLYGMVGYPNYVPTEYLVNPSETYGYHVITIHYAYVGANESVQKSERDITIAVPAEGATTYTKVNDLIEAINDVAGITVFSAKLS